MVTYDKNEKDLVIPSALGLAGMQDSVCGVTEQEVIEIVESAITDYDTEIQVDLEDIRENVSGNTNDIAALSAATEALEQRVDNISTSALTEQIEALSGSVGDIRSDVETLSGDTDSIRTDVAALSAATSGVAGDIVALSAATSGIAIDVESAWKTEEILRGDLTSLSGRTSAITEQVTELSGVTSGISADVATLSGAAQETYDAIFYEDEGETYSQIDDLWGALGEKQDVLEISSGLTLNDNVLKVNKGHALTFNEGGKLEVNFGKGVQYDGDDALELKIGEGLGFSGDTLVVSGLSAEVAALSAVTSGIAVDVETLSAITNGIVSSGDVVYDYNEIYGSTSAQKQAIWSEIGSYANTHRKVWLRRRSGTQVLWFLCYDFNAPYIYFVANDKDSIYQVLFHQNGSISVNQKYILPTASSDTLGGVKVGSGLTISNGVLSVSGGTGGGGIEKVSTLPLTAEEGDVVWLEGHTQSGYTITMDMSEKSFESGYLMAEINWNGYECEVGANYGVWQYSAEYGAKLRSRRNGSTRYLDIITDNNVSLGQDADSMQTGVEFPFLGKFYAYEGGKWHNIAREVYVDFDKEPNKVKEYFLEIYSGLTDFDGSDLVIFYRQDSDVRTYAAFKPYFSAHYGMDCQSNDSRGARDGSWGQIRVDMNRLSYDWEQDSISFNTLVGTKWSVTEDHLSNIPSISSVGFGNGDRGGLTYDADNDEFLYDSNTVATGDTQNYCEDLLDYNYLKSLFTRNGMYENSTYLINAHTLDVTSGGTIYQYTAPTLALNPITTYSIGDYTFATEVTFKYADWELKIDLAEYTNVGANLRITAL